MFTANSPKRRKALRRFGDRARSVRREEAKGAVMAMEIEAAGRAMGEEVMEVRVAVRVAVRAVGRCRA